MLEQRFARAAKEIDRAIAKAGQAPRGVTTQVRGQVNALRNLWRIGRWIWLSRWSLFCCCLREFSIVSPRLGRHLSVPAVLVGAILMLLITALP